MERRGAAEVVAIDILDPRRWDWPANSTRGGGRSARASASAAAPASSSPARRFGSAVERRELSVYELDPGEVGSFDFVYVGSLLLHLRDPVGALAAVRSVCAGDAVIVDAIDLAKTLRFPRQPVATLDGRGRPWWWKPNLAALARLAEAAGFELAAPPRRLYMPPGEGHPRRLTRPAPAALGRGSRAAARELARRPARRARPCAPRAG